MKTISFDPLNNFVNLNPESISRNYSFEEIEYIDISSVASGYLNEKPKTINIKEAPSRAKRIVKENDIIIAQVRPNLRSFLFIKNPKENTIVSTGFAVLRAKKILIQDLFIIPLAKKNLQTISLIMQKEHHIQL